MSSRKPVQKNAEDDLVAARRLYRSWQNARRKEQNIFFTILSVAALVTFIVTLLLIPLSEWMVWAVVLITLIAVLSVWFMMSKKLDGTSQT